MVEIKFLVFDEIYKSKIDLIDLERASRKTDIIYAVKSISLEEIENQAKEALFMIKYDKSERDWMRDKAKVLQFKGTVKVDLDIQQYSDFINRRRCKGLIYYNPQLPFPGATDL